MTTSHEHVMLIYQWFSSAMRKAGRKESFPKGTDPRKTYKYRALEKFAKNQNLFVEGEHKIRLTRKQERFLLDSLRRGRAYYYSSSFGQPSSGDYVLALAFGENPDVNAELAAEIQRLVRRVGDVVIYAQWEIADLLHRLDEGCRRLIHRIDLDPGREYITTDEIVQKFIACVSTHSADVRPAPKYVFVVFRQRVRQEIEYCTSPVKMLSRTLSVPQARHCLSKHRFGAKCIVRISRTRACARQQCSSLRCPPLFAS